MNAYEITFYFIASVFAKHCYVVADKFLEEYSVAFIFLSPLLHILNLISRNNKCTWKLPQIVFLWCQEINLAMKKVITSS